MTDGPIFKAEDGSLWRWNAFRSDLQRLAAVSADKQAGTSVASEPKPSVEVERLREALEAHDAQAAECRIDGKRPQRDTSLACDRCGAEASGSCGLKAGAAYTFIKTARATLSRKQEPGVPTPGAWVEWSGGENPVPGKVVDVAYGDPPFKGYFSDYGDLADWSGATDDKPSAYRIVPTPGGAE